MTAHTGLTQLLKELMMSTEGNVTLDYLSSEIGEAKNPISQAMTALVNRNIGFERVSKGVYRYVVPRKRPRVVANQIVDPPANNYREEVPVAKRIRPGFYVHDSMEIGSRLTFEYVGKVTEGYMLRGQDGHMFVLRKL